MIRRTRSTVITPLVLALCVASVVTGCGGRQNGAGGTAAGTSTRPSASTGPVTYRIDNTATGPAPAVEGAGPGGTVRVYDEADYQHLDPARIYTTYETTLSTLLTRGLTGFRQKGSEVSLVGDLATDTGRTSDGGKTWTWTLREGVTWEDGAPITTAQIKYGLERTFVKEYAEGPTYLQTWLADSADFAGFHPGPYDGKSLDAISAPDERTLTIRFSKPRPDVPFAMSLPFSAPVRPDKDTRSAYTQKPFSSGPYRITARQVDKSMTLERNPNWKPQTDPIRTAYPDRFEFTFGERPVATNQRLIGGAGDDAAAMTVNNPVSQEVLPQVLGSPELVARTVSGLTPGMEYVAINTRRITDLRVRKALMYAYPRAQARQASGGPDLGDFATTLSSPTLLGHEPYDLFSVPTGADPDKARALLTEAGKLGQVIVHAYIGNERNQKRSVVVAQALERAGFKVVGKPLPTRNGFDEVANPDNAFDMYYLTWFADWPSGSTVFTPLFDGRLIRKGSYNVSFFNDPGVNARIDEISAIGDPVEAGRQWAALERTIMAQVPMFPDLYTRTRRLFGPRLGGVTLDLVLGKAALNGVFVRP